MSWIFRVEQAGRYTSGGRTVIGGLHSSKPQVEWREHDFSRYEVTFIGDYLPSWEPSIRCKSLGLIYLSSVLFQHRSTLQSRRGTDTAEWEEEHWSTMIFSRVLSHEEIQYIISITYLSGRIINLLSLSIHVSMKQYLQEKHWRLFSPLCLMRNGFWYSRLCDLQHYWINTTLCNRIFNSKDNLQRLLQNLKLLCDQAWSLQLLTHIDMGFNVMF